jgi:hypothetical protein
MMNQDIIDDNQTVNEPPRFDAETSAKAQPVEPIRPNRFSSVANSLRSLRKRANGQVRVLTAVVIVGLITGALAGILLVKLARNNQTTAEINTEPAKVSEIQATEARALDAYASELSSEIDTPRPSSGQLAAQPFGKQLGKYGRARRATDRPRAYRVAVIR